MKKLMITFLIIFAFFVGGCGEKEEVEKETSFEINEEQLESEGYDKIADIAYGKIEEENEDVTIRLVYYRNEPEMSIYLMGMIMQSLDYNADFIVEWEGKEYIFNKDMEEPENLDDIFSYFPQEWQEPMKNMQGVGIDNFITKASTDSIEEEVERFLDKYKKELSNENTERQNEETGTENQSKEINTIKNKTYEIDGEELILALQESEGEITFTSYAHVKSENKASLMLAVLKSSFDELGDSIDGYNITIFFGDLYVSYITTESGFIAMGKNRDGSTSISFPDWVSSELKMSEEDANAYVGDILDALKNFSESGT